MSQKSAAEGPPPKKARPSSLEDVVLSKAAAAPGQGAGAKSGRGMLTLEEVIRNFQTQSSITA